MGLLELVKCLKPTSANARFLMPVRARNMSDSFWPNGPSRTSHATVADGKRYGMSVIMDSLKKLPITPDAMPAWTVPACTASTYSRSAPSWPAPKTCTSSLPPLWAFTMLANAMHCACFLEVVMSTASACASFRITLVAAIPVVESANIARIMPTTSTLISRFRFISISLLVIWITLDLLGCELPFYLTQHS